MALTISRNRPANLGNLRARVATVTFDAAYLAGGELLAPRDVGLSDIALVLVQPDGASTGAGYVVRYDYTAGSLRVFNEEAVAAGGPLLEVGAIDLSGLTVRLLILGH